MKAVDRELPMAPRMTLNECMEGAALCVTCVRKVTGPSAAHIKLIKEHLPFVTCEMGSVQNKARLGG